MNLEILLNKKQSIAFWLILWSVQSLLMSGGKEVDFYLVKNIVIVSLQFLVVSLNFKWLFPVFFEKEKYIIYVLLSIVLVYVVFSISYILIDFIFDLYYPNFTTSVGYFLATDFWRILSGSSFYSLALVCSLVYRLLQTNQEKEDVNFELKKQLNEDSEKDNIIIKEGQKTHRILARDIYFIKGLKEYVVWHTESKNIIVLQTMSGIESNYKEKGLLRVHKSYIVNMMHVNSFESNSLKVLNEVIPIGRAYKKNVIEFLENKPLFK